MWGKETDKWKIDRYKIQMKERVNRQEKEGRQKDGQIDRQTKRKINQKENHAKRESKKDKKGRETDRG